MSWFVTENHQTSQTAIGENFVASGNDENQMVIGNEEPDLLAAMANSSVGPADQNVQPKS